MFRASCNLAQWHKENLKPLLHPKARGILSLTLALHRVWFRAVLCPTGEAQQCPQAEW